MTGIPIVPQYITVHLGRPDAYAANITVPFIEYIKNVASSEIYPTWPENALRANIYAQVTFAMNRIYTEWYRSRGYNFDITNSTQYDQAYIHGREIFSNISNLVDELFNDYVRRQGYIEPLFTQFCNGTTVTCDGLSQWGTVTLANQGLSPYQILQRYYGNDIDIVTNAPVGSITPSYPGYPLGIGSVGRAVRILQFRLNRISSDYPAIPKVSIDGQFGPSTQDAVRSFQRIFNLTADGTVGEATWYRLERIYTAVKNLAELGSEGYSLSEYSTQFPQVLQLGTRAIGVSILQHRLRVIAAYYDTIPAVSVDGIFGEGTRNAVIAFQNRFGLSPDGVVGKQTWEEIYRVYRGILNSNVELVGGELPLPWNGVVMQYGSRGENVRALQQYLNEIAKIIPNIPIVEVTGYFGDNTRNAVRLFQSELDLPVDGIVGERTWNTLTSIYSDIRSGLTPRPEQFPGSTLREGT